MKMFNVISIIAVICLLNAVFSVKGQNGVYQNLHVTDTLRVGPNSIIQAGNQIYEDAQDLFINGNPAFGFNTIINANSGLTGIGTPNPASKLHVTMNTGGDGVLISREGIVYGGLPTRSFFEVKERQLGQIGIGGGVGLTPYQTHFIVREDGKVGIGTGHPQSELHVLGEMQLGGVSKWRFGRGAVSSPADLEIENLNTKVTGNLLVKTNGNVGINENDPLAQLHVSQGSLLFEGNTGSTPISGPGYRMMWVPEKGAFRSGRVNLAQWDAANIGNYSTAMGLGVEASGESAFAAGSFCNASGKRSVAMGASNIATADHALALGRLNEATGNNSFAAGFRTEAAGDYSISLGRQCKAIQVGSVSIGSFSWAVGENSLALGAGASTEGIGSVAIGSAVNANADYSFVIGSGLGFFGGGQLHNYTENSLIIGFESSIPSFFVGPAATADTFGWVGIGTRNPQNVLDVNGGINALEANVCGIIRAEEIIVETGFCDYVFEEDYDLMSLENVDAFIQQEGHLPGIPPAKEIEENGLRMAAMQVKMMEKIEELTLYIIAQDKRTKNLQQQLDLLVEENDRLKDPK